MLICEVLSSKLFIAQDVCRLPHGDRFRLFRPAGVAYHPFCDDFGPMNLSSVALFCEQLNIELKEHPDSRIIYSVDQDPRSLTNAVFLVGAYLILLENKAAADVLETFDWLDDSLVEHFRDATYSHADFRLTLEDCWRGLERGVTLGWLRAPEDEVREMWGEINIPEYLHYDSPANGDFHVVVPGRFIAFKGPADLGGLAYADGDDGARTFSPSAYADIFADDFGVAAVVQLNEEQYDPAAFTARGIRHHALPFPDCASPPPAVFAAFLNVADAALAAGGAVAVHCLAGLGRTGTLIALHLMRSHGFTAREAMGWLRVMRPGSVIGPQQHFLCAAEARPDAGGGPRLLGYGPGATTSGREGRRRQGGGSGDGSDGEAAEREDSDEAAPRRRLAAEVAGGALRRGAARARAEGAGGA